MMDTAGLHSALFDCASDTVKAGLNQTAFEADQSSGSEANPHRCERDRQARRRLYQQLLVGNKCELSSKKVVSTGETKELADSLNIRLLEASAKNVHNVEEVFNMGASRQTRKPCRLQ